MFKKLLQKPAKEPPFTDVELILKQINPATLNDLGRDALNQAFTGFYNEVEENQEEQEMQEFSTKGLESMASKSPLLPRKFSRAKASLIEDMLETRVYRGADIILCVRMKAGMTMAPCYRRSARTITHSRQDKY